MTRNKKGDCIFNKDRYYTPVAAFTPLWMPGVKVKCLETATWRYADQVSETVVENGKGLFTVGDDSRWYVASEQFQEA
jgi:hypothetical protein